MPLENFCCNLGGADILCDVDNDTCCSFTCTSKGDINNCGFCGNDCVAQADAVACFDSPGCEQIRGGDHDQYIVDAYCTVELNCPEGQTWRSVPTGSGLFDYEWQCLDLTVAIPKGLSGAPCSKNEDCNSGVCRSPCDSYTVACSLSKVCIGRALTGG